MKLSWFEKWVLLKAYGILEDTWTNRPVESALRDIVSRTKENLMIIIARAYQKGR